MNGETAPAARLHITGNTCGNGNMKSVYGGKYVSWRLKNGRLIKRGAGTAAQDCRVEKNTSPLSGNKLVLPKTADFVTKQLTAQALLTRLIRTIQE